MSDRDDLRERIAQVLYDSDFDTEDWADSRRAADAVLAALPPVDGPLRQQVAAVADRIDNHARRPASDPAYSGAAVSAGLRAALEGSEGSAKFSGNSGDGSLLSESTVAQVQAFLIAYNRHRTDHEQSARDLLALLEAHADTPIPSSDGPLREVASWLLRLKDGPRDESYEREKPQAWDALRRALMRAAPSRVDDRPLRKALRRLVEEWRYKGEFGWGPWQEGYGPDPDGTVLDDCATRLRALLDETEADR